MNVFITAFHASDLDNVTKMVMNLSKSCQNISYSSAYICSVEAEAIDSKSRCNKFKNLLKQGFPVVLMYIATELVYIK